MRSLMWMNAVVACLFLALSAGGYLYGQRWFLFETPPPVAQKITEIQDIEHLRKLALLLVRGNDQTIRGTNEVIRKALNTISMLALAFAVICIVNWLSVLKHQRATQGRPIRWLAWL